MIRVQPTKGRDGCWGEIVPELPNNTYGRWRVSRMAGGGFTVFDPESPNEAIVHAPTFPSENAARAWAQAMSRPRACVRYGDPILPEESVLGCSSCEAA
jgi:hypothetical protein